MVKIIHKNLPQYLQKEHNADITAESFIDHMIAKIDASIGRKQRSLILTLTKKSSEEITNFMLSKWYKTFYLHSEIDTIDRREIIQKLKTGEIDVLVGINLLREGIDLPEVWFIAILDADKEGFLRSTTALIQNIWRAARNPDSEVALYADRFTKSIIQSLRETYRRRAVQLEFNKENNITPTQAESNVKALHVVRTDEELQKHKEYQLVRSWKVKKLKRMTKKEKAMITNNLREQLEVAIKERKFEEAAVIRDQLKEIEEQ